LAEAYLGYDDIGWFLLGAAGIGAAVAVPASLAALRGGLPGWFGWLGVALGSCPSGRSPSSGCSRGWLDRDRLDRDAGRAR
jgi:hypothetical protein